MEVDPQPGGAAEVDRETFATLQAHGVKRMLPKLRDAHRAGGYRHAPVRTRTIPKPGGGERQSGIPTVRDQVVQKGTELLLVPIPVADFSPPSCAFLPRRSATEALERIRLGLPKGPFLVLECSIRALLGEDDHTPLIETAGKRASEPRLPIPTRLYLTAGLMEEGQGLDTVSLKAQGATISPLLSDISLHGLDGFWAKRLAVQLLRFANDFVVLRRSDANAETALTTGTTTLARLGLTLHLIKTRLVDLGQGREAANFLGCRYRVHIPGRLSDRCIRFYYLQCRPAHCSMAETHPTVHVRTDRILNGMTGSRRVLSELNPVVRGSRKYLCPGTQPSSSRSRATLPGTSAALPHEALRTGCHAMLGHLTVDRLVARPGSAPIAWHHSLFGGSATMRRRSPVTRVGAHDALASKGEWRDGPAAPARRP